MVVAVIVTMTKVEKMAKIIDVIFGVIAADDE